MPDGLPPQTSHRAAFSIRAHLVAAGLALVLPILLFAGVVLWRLAVAEQRRYEADAQQIVRRAAFAVDQSLTGAVATLQALATSPALLEENFEAFHAQVQALVRAPGTHIVLRDVAGRQIVNSRLPWGAPLPLAGERAADEEAIRTGAPTVSDLMTGALTRRRVVTVNLPVQRRGTTAFVLSANIAPEHLRDLIGAQDLPEGWVVGLIDRNRVFIARSRGHEASVGRQAGDDIEALAGRQEGVVERVNVDGKRVMFAFARPRLAGWLVGIGVPRRVVDAPLRRSLWITAGLGAGLLGLSMGLAFLFGRRVAKPVRDLSAAAAALGRGERVEAPASTVREVAEVGRRLAGASAALRERSEALATSEERYRLATEAFHGAVFDYDVAADRTERSDWHYRIVGEEPGGFALDRSGWYERIHPEDKPAFDAARAELFEGGARQYEAEYRVRHRDGSWVWVWHRALAMRDEGGTLRRVVGAILDVTERKRFEEHLRLLIDELNHRVKNTLATVQSIAAQTLRSSGSDAEARDAFEARLIALSSAHNVLTRRNWEGATLPDIVQVALAPHRVGRADRIETCGPDLWVEPRAALALAMALHELATNAAKYGALSNREGTVEVTWRVEPDREGREGEGSRRAHLAWTERGGPRVEPPTRRGFGTRLIERSLSGDLEGRAEIAYAPEGFRCTVSWPLPRR